MLKIFIQSIIKPVVNTFFPPVCFICDSFLENDRKVICVKCWSEMKAISEDQKKSFENNLNPKYFDNFYILFDFSDTFQKIIHLLKYQRCLSLSKYFADEIKKRFGKSFFKKYNIIIPVPLHPVKYRERGYNQSYEILKHLDGTVNKTVLNRIKNTVSQTKLSREDRIKNVNDAFYCDQSFKGENILLFDDIITTGSTVNACAITLKNCGCSRVDVLALATPTSAIN